MSLPVFFISHGGGPWPWIPEMRSSYPQTLKMLAELGESLRPSAVLILTSHWEEENFTVSSTERPEMIYDYSGFPPETYKIHYKAPGDPKLSHKILGLLKAKGISAKEDATRGFDHGTFVPLFCLYPKADIPVVQLSIKHSYMPDPYIKLGEALASLRNENVLILGSGLSYHNLRQMFAGQGGADAEAFGNWLKTTMKLPREERIKQLYDWSKAPGARASHPREDHLMPLFTIVGAAGDDPGEVFIQEVAMGVEMLSFKFSQSPT